MIEPKKEFPDTHIDLPPWAQFIVKRGHTKLFIPEQLLLSEADYKKQQQLKEEQIAKEIEMSQSHLDPTEQQKMLDEANAQLPAYRVKQSQGKRCLHIHNQNFY